MEEVNAPLDLRNALRLEFEVARFSTERTPAEQLGGSVVAVASSRRDRQSAVGCLGAARRVCATEKDERRSLERARRTVLELLIAEATSCIDQDPPREIAPRLFP